MRKICACVVAAIAALALAAAPAGATAASPVLEFSVPGNSFPVGFTATGGEVTAALTEFGTVVHCTGSHGAGKITGPRSTVSSYVFTGCETQGTDAGRTCKSAAAGEKEITSQEIESELVYLDQARHEVAMLMNPHGDTYMDFECSGEAVEASGPFLSPVGPINQEATSFTASLSSLDAMQTPDEYEGPANEMLQAIPMGKWGSNQPKKTGVELSFAIQTDVPLAIKAVNVFEITAQQIADELFAEATARRHQEEEAATKKHKEEEASAAAIAAKKLQEEQNAKAERLKRRRLLSKALKQCRKADSKYQRVRCEKRAKRKYQARPVAHATALRND
jgi:hypothetical protein